ncbi:hypothetical protein Tco_1103831 [Tanacetum coccineum]
MLGGGENVTQADTEEPFSHAEGEHVSMDDDTEKPESEKAKEEPTNTGVPYMINGKMHYLTNDDINAHLDKEDKIKKAAEEAKRLEMTKTKVIKIVQEEAEKIGIDPKKIIGAKACEKFKKA